MIFHRRTCSEGRAVRDHKPAKDSSLGVTSPFLASFSLHPLSFFVFSPSLSFKIAIYRSTRHLSPFRGLLRMRAFRLHLDISPRNSRRTPSCLMEKKQRRRRNRVEKRMLRNSRIASAFEVTEFFRETGWIDILSFICHVILNSSYYANFLID